MTSALIGTDAVTTTWADGSHLDLPHLWLRDNCLCNDCRSVQTAEKIFHLSAVDADLAPTAAVVEDDHLSLTWPDGHRSVFARADIDRFIAGRAPVAPEYWSAGFEPTRVTHAAFMGDGPEAISSIEAFLRTGVLVLTECPTEPNSLEDLAPRLGPVREMLFARIHDVVVDPSGYNVAHTPLAVPPHNDFAGMGWPPSVQALHMLVNEVDGGESIVVDGWQILEAMRRDQPEHFDALCSVPVPFRMYDDAHETYCVSPLVELEPDGSIRRFRYSNQVMQPMNPTAPGAAAFYRAYHALSHAVADPANRALFRLEGGHTLLVASHRVLHAREAFVPNGARHLQDAYFEHDNLRNALVVLQRQGEPPARVG